MATKINGNRGILVSYLGRGLPDNSFTMCRAAPLGVRYRDANLSPVD